MSNTILLKRSDVENSTPSSANLVPGELALNFADGNLFFKNSSNNIVLLASTQTLDIAGNITGGNLITAGITSTAILSVTGNADVGNLGTVGQVIATGNITGGNLRATVDIEIQNRGILYLNTTDNSQYIGLRSPATLTDNFIYTFPANYGVNNQVLTTNGAGSLRWEDPGGASGATQFPNSTVQPVPGSEGNFDLSFNFAQTVQEIPFEATTTDAFGVNLGEVYSMMDPVGEVLNPVDLGVLT